MKYLLVAHPEPGQTTHLPNGWTGNNVDRATYTGCCPATRETCEALLKGASIAPTLLEIQLRLVAPCLNGTTALLGAQAFHHTRAVRKWLARHNPRYGLIVGGAGEINAVLMGMCDELKNYLLCPGSSVLIVGKGLQHDFTFYQPRR